MKMKSKAINKILDLRKFCISMVLTLILALAITSILPIPAGATDTGTYGSVNLAKDKPLSSVSPTVLGSPAYINDGDWATEWLSYEGSGYNYASFILDLQAVYKIGKINFRMDRHEGYDISTSTDGTTWTLQHSANWLPWLSSLAPVSLTPDGTYEAQYIKYYGYAHWNQHVGVIEIEVYEWVTPSPPPPPGTYGSVNLALNRPVVGTSIDPSYPASNAVDGNPSTISVGSGYYGPYGGSNAYHTFGVIEIDLGASYPIGKIVVKPDRIHYYAIYANMESTASTQIWKAPLLDTHPELYGTNTAFGQPRTFLLNGSVSARYLVLEMSLDGTSSMIMPAVAEIEVYEWVTPAYAAAITGMTVVPDPVGQGSKMIFTVDVQNTGSKDISTAKVQLKIYKPAGSLASSPFKSITSFKAGTERTVEVTYTLSSSAPLGYWTYRVYVYRGSTLLDQVTDQGFTVQPAVKTGEILSVTANPDPVGRGGATAFTVTFNNTGNVVWSTAKLTAKIHKPGSTTVYVTRSLTVSNIAPNVEYSRGVMWTPSSSALLGTYTYDVYLTYGSLVLDSSIGNTVTVEPIVKTGEIVSVADAPDPLARPGTATFTVTVKNTGNTIWSSGKVTIKIHKPGSATVYTTKSLSISNIVPGVEYTYNVKWTVSSSATTGTYTYDVYFYYGTSTLMDSDVGNPSNTIQVN